MGGNIFAFLILTAKRILIPFLIIIFMFFSLFWTEVLKDYIKPDGECLELFARNLQPGWTSWGNEVLKFQHVDYFLALESRR